LTDNTKKSYGQVLKSSALIGGSAGLNSVVQIARTKAMALLLEPSGFGLFGLYWQLAEMVRSVSGMGINSSSVRQIAEAAGTGNSRHIARTVTTLRRVAFLLGGLGAVFMVVFSKFLSKMTFGDESHAVAVAFLGLAAMFGEISAAQGALLQGMRRIADLARLNVVGTFLGSVISIAIIYAFARRGIAENGVVPALVCGAGMNIVISWWFARKVKVDRVSLSLKESAAEASELLKLGVAFMSGALAETGALYLVKIIVLRELGADDVGFYQAAWALGGYYVGFILQAMGADFYPRLTAAAQRDEECNRLVNEQAEVGVLIAGPGMLATISFAPLFISLFYSSKFGPAVEVLRWICLGMVLRVVSWPMSFIVLAKGLRTIYLVSEVLIRVVYIGLFWVAVKRFQLEGTGMAFLGMYVIYTIGIYAVVHRITGFRLSRANTKLALVLAPLVVIVFVSPRFLGPVWAMVFGGVITFGAGIYCLRTLCTLIPCERLPRSAQRLLRICRLTRPVELSEPVDKALHQNVETERTKE
jgi:PST family polysaccharide transporter